MLEGYSEKGSFDVDMSDNCFDSGEEAFGSSSIDYDLSQDL